MRKNSIFTRTLMLTPIACFLALLLAFSGIPAAQAAVTSTKSNQQKGSFVKKAVKVNKRQVLGYWTPARMKQARPAEELLARQPKWKAFQTQTVSSSKKAAASVIRPQAYSIPTGSYADYPYSTIGKVFFTDSRTGYNYVCSATAVNSGNRSTVDTAGHCVIEGGSGDNYYTNWSFCPQYIYGSCPRGVWTARLVSVSSNWANYGDFSSDLAAVVVNTNDNGESLNDVVGGVEFGANFSRGLYVTALGYPAAPPFNGSTMESCSGTTFNYPGGNPQPIGLSCDLTGGSSGGGWLSSIGGTWYVVGHNDFTSSAYSNVMWSPYYGDDAQGVFNSVQGS